MSYAYYPELAAPTDGYLGGFSCGDGHKAHGYTPSSPDTGDSRADGLGYCGNLGDRPIWTLGWDPATYDVTMWVGDGMSLHLARFPSSSFRVIKP